MIRNLKVLGVAFIAVSALSAAVASAALAQQGMLTSDGPVTLKGTPTGIGSANQFEGFGGFVRCPGSVLTGHKYNVTPHTFVEPGASKFTLTPDFVNCTTTLGSLENAPTTIDMNGCDYQVEIGETSGGEGEYTGFGSVVCSPGVEVQMTVFSSSAHSLRLCTLSTSNSGSGGGKVTNTTTEGVDDLDISGTIVGLTVKKSGLCGSATDTEARLKGDATIQGYNEEGAQTGITVTHS
jgi:hypothetical protein